MKILAGNARVQERVEAFIENGRLPHAIMLEGNEGTGKHTLARHIAAAAVCEGENKPCNRCTACHLFSVGSHPDIKIITPEKKQLSVDEVRALRQDAFLKPALSDRKVYIIERCEAMQAPAQNALLKILEEPPQGVIFILITLSAEKLLTTVRSRCITLSLTEPKEEEAISLLKEITSNSGEEIRSALGRSKNNIGVALSYLSGKEKNSYAAVASDIISMISAGKEYDMLKKLHSFDRDRAAAAAIFDELCERLAMLLRESCYTHIKEGLSREQIVRLYDVTVSLKASLESNANLMLLFANLCNEYKSVLD